MAIVTVSNSLTSSPNYTDFFRVAADSSSVIAFNNEASKIGTLRGAAPTSETITASAYSASFSDGIDPNAIQVQVLGTNVDKLFGATLATGTSNVTSISWGYPADQLSFYLGTSGAGIWLDHDTGAASGTLTTLSFSTPWLSVAATGALTISDPGGPAPTTQSVSGTFSEVMFSLPQDGYALRIVGSLHHQSYRSGQTVFGQPSIIDQFYGTATQISLTGQGATLTLNGSLTVADSNVAPVTISGAITDVSFTMDGYSFTGNAINKDINGLFNTDGTMKDFNADGIANHLDWQPFLLSGDDTVSGGAGDDSLIGGAGDDTLDGGAGSDTATYSGSRSNFTITRSGVNYIINDITGANGTDTLTNIESLQFSDMTIALVESIAGIIVTGGAGDDILTGGAGDDILTGGAGTDTFNVDAGTDTLADALPGTDIINISSGATAVQSLTTATASYATNTTNSGMLVVNALSSTASTVTGSSGIDSITGSSADDNLDGSAGNDILKGGTGHDVMTGGSGNDTYHVDSAGDSIVETASGSAALSLRLALDLGGGIDKVIASISYTLGNFLENLELASGSGNLAGTGNALDNVLTGNEGNNTLTGGAGNDTLDGGTGIDIAIYTGNRAGFTLAQSGTGFIVTDTTGALGADTLTNIERLIFTDASLALNLAGVAGTGAIGNYNAITHKFYVAYFGRAADTGGLLNMTTQLNTAAAPFGSTQAFIDAYAANATVRTIIDSFGNSAESMALYPGTTAELVTAIYQNVLGRAPLAAGLNYWSNLVDSGAINRGQAALTIMAGAEANTTPQGLIDAALVANRITVAANFTTAMDTTVEADSYRGAAAAAAVRSMLGTVNQDTSVFDFQTTVESTLVTLVGSVVG